MLRFPLRQTSSFKGDKEMHLDKLIQASQRKVVDDFSLSERQLVPFFDGSMAKIDEAHCQPLQQRSHLGVKHTNGATPPSKNIKHSNSHSTPIASGAQRKRGDRTEKKNQEALNGNVKQNVKAENTNANSNTNSTPHSTRKSKGKKSTNGESTVVPSQQRAAGLRKHNRDSSQKQLQISEDVPLARSPRVKRHVVDAISELSTVSSARFAGPAFVNSPTPDSLPIPTTSLLALHETVDRIQAGLVL